MGSIYVGIINWLLHLVQLWLAMFPCKLSCMMGSIYVGIINCLFHLVQLWLAMFPYKLSSDRPNSRIWN